MTGLNFNSAMNQVVGQFQYGGQQLHNPHPGLSPQAAQLMSVNMTGFGPEVLPFPNIELQTLPPELQPFRVILEQLTGQQFAPAPPPANTIPEVLPDPVVETNPLPPVPLPPTVTPPPRPPLLEQLIETFLNENPAP